MMILAIFPIQVDPLILESLTKAKQIPAIPPNQNLRQIGLEAQVL